MPWFTQVVATPVICSRVRNSTGSVCRAVGKGSASHHWQIHQQEAAMAATATAAYPSGTGTNPAHKCSRARVLPQQLPCNMSPPGGPCMCRALHQQ